MDTQQLLSTSTRSLALNWKAVHFHHFQHFHNFSPISPCCYFKDLKRCSWRIADVLRRCGKEHDDVRAPFLAAVFWGRHCRVSSAGEESGAERAEQGRFARGLPRSPLVLCSRATRWRSAQLVALPAPARACPQPVLLWIFLHQSFTFLIAGETQELPSVVAEKHDFRPEGTLSRASGVPGAARASLGSFIPAAREAGGFSPCRWVRAGYGVAGLCGVTVGGLPSLEEKRSQSV